MKESADERMERLLLGADDGEAEDAAPKPLTVPLAVEAVYWMSRGDEASRHKAAILKLGREIARLELELRALKP